MEVINRIGMFGKIGALKFYSRDVSGRGRGRGNIICCVSIPTSTLLRESPIYAGFARKMKNRGISNLFPLTPGSLQKVEFQRREITVKDKVAALKNRFSQGMFYGRQSSWLGEINIPADLDLARCVALTYGRVKLTLFTPLPPLGGNKSHVFSVSVRHRDTGDIIMGHGILEHTKGSNRLYFRYSIHNGVTVVTEDNILASMINFRNMGYAKEVLILLMAAGMRRGLFADTIRKFQFKLYPKSDFDSHRNLLPDIQNMLGFLVQAGFDASGCFDAGRQARRASK